MCIIFTILTWPENPADAMHLRGPKFQNIPQGVCPQTPCFHMLTFHTLRSVVYVALRVPEQLPYSSYTPGDKVFTLRLRILQVNKN